MKKSKSWQKKSSNHAYKLASIEVWKAYEQLEKSKVKGVPPKELLTNIVSLIRFSTGLSDVLEPFPELVEQRFQNWLKQQHVAKTPSPLGGEGWDEGGLRVRVAFHQNNSTG